MHLTDQPHRPPWWFHWLAGIVVGACTSLGTALAQPDFNARVALAALLSGVVTGAGTAYAIKSGGSRHRKGH